ncbi:MAG: hypothetical protein C4524_04115 [Candidatus Zixiibacteriota bacterium]|nr:MAG: hypothetical protein C4524_04115 [candidate division Zixibacteria bacterium]
MTTEYHQALQMAQDPDTPPEVLRRLADLPGLAVKVALRLNPSTPAEVRDRLAAVLGALCKYEMYARPKGGNRG